MIPSFLLFIFAAGCSPTHMQYDFGRSFTESTRIQADLDRSTVRGTVYPLSGVEAVEIRLRVQESTSDEESGESKLKASSSD